jgi:hypothetical protein
MSAVGHVPEVPRGEKEGRLRLQSGSLHLSWQAGEQPQTARRSRNLKPLKKRSIFDVY